MTGVSARVTESTTKSLTEPGNPEEMGYNGIQQKYNDLKVYRSQFNPLYMWP